MYVIVVRRGEWLSVFTDRVRVCDIIILITCVATGSIIVRETDGVSINCVVCRSSCH